MSRASTRFTEALLLLLMFFLFVSFCSTGWGVKAKQSGLIKQNHQTSQLKVAQGKISGRERNKISKGTILTKAPATAKRPHSPGFPPSLELSHSSQATTPTATFVFGSTGRKSSSCSAVPRWRQGCAHLCCVQQPGFRLPPGIQNQEAAHAVGHTLLRWNVFSLSLIKAKQPLAELWLCFTSVIHWS